MERYSALVRSADKPSHRVETLVVMRVSKKASTRGDLYGLAGDYSSSEN
jgi:hypothetical protein